MHRVQLHYTLSRDAGNALIRNPLPELLQAVSEQGSISGAARGLGLSYRHVWGALKRWEDQLGGELIVWGKGQSAQLSEFGTKLLWAERQAQARLAPQIAALHADLERAFAVAFDPHAHVLTLYASHDDALVALRAHAATPSEAGALHLDIRFTGSVDAIRALNEGRCTLAGFHTVEHAASDAWTARTYKPLLQPGLHKIIGFAQRTQGLIVAPGNPLGLHRLADVARTGARFVNRPLGSGTRVLLDDLLAQAGIATDAITGYGLNEPSHTAIAQAVAAGAADVGMGIELAARARGLGFVPLVHERYHLACLKASLDQPATLALRQLLQTPDWQAHMAALPGYAPLHCGEVLAMSTVLPWWQFARQKRSAAPRKKP
ncbi:MAG: helix-turn-helix transcriptional regulator [Gammaproteobacteria bacterium]|nr:helix-turn-helix transcriptional regulator [Gammaproteobacteria bacterium]MBU1508181.1 helix-turn-helix transcriptional regulator [Gammaproteobacteria bacterium]MBU2120744.1 helix-turn-helix transcriptional regulator [Gammaproteobacteria bacterium]MBU2169419.1 helix-turn-helix transcriptional regulator [Gammaproteobacteria bacterium]MBU2200501.1 helix-turn-helix transcriptional regulator [Gammaproteobacteria bacterium]